MISNEIRKLLLSIHTADRNVVCWYDDHELPDGLTRKLIREADRLGLLHHRIGNAWQEFEEVKLTRKGLIAAGIPVAPTFLDRLLDRFRLVKTIR